MAALTGGAIKVENLDHLRLTELLVTAITDGDTLVTGIPGIVKVMTRGASASTVVALANDSASDWNGSIANTRRVQAYLTNAATGEITFDSTTAAAVTIAMIWHKS